MSKHGFICAGCWTSDRVKLIDRWPSEEELAIISRTERQGGGSAHNVGIDLRILDPSIPVSTVGVIGNDEDGDFLYAQASRYQIDTQQLYRTDAAPTSFTDVMSVEHSGKRTFFHHTGANDLLTPEHFNFNESKEKILHLGLLSVHALMDAKREDGSNGWSEVLKLAQEMSILTSIEMVSVDAEKNRELVTPCLPYIDYLVVNDHEIGSIANIETLSNGTTDKQRCMDAAEFVLKLGAMKLIAVHYPTGAICLTREGNLYDMPSFKIPHSYIQGSVGAGDAFVAGFLYALHENWAVDKALQLAHSVAAVSLRSATTIGAVESVENCQSIAQRMHSAYVD